MIPPDGGGAEGSVNSAGTVISNSFACAMSAPPACPPNELSALFTTSSFIAQSGTGRAGNVAQLFGLRGLSKVNTESNVRADASRCVNGSPSPQTFRNCRDHKCVPILIVEYRALLHPRRHHDRRNPVAASIELEAKFTRRSGRVGWGYCSWGHVIVRSNRASPPKIDDGESMGMSKLCPTSDLPAAG